MRKKNCAARTGTHGGNMSPPNPNSPKPAAPAAPLGASFSGAEESYHSYLI